MLKLYNYEVSIRRMGTVEGLFVATDEEIEKLDGRTIYFGEILGKHSDIDITFEKDYFTVKSDDQDFITKLIEVMDGKTTISGYNPLNYIYEDEE